MKYRKEDFDRHDELVPTTTAADLANAEATELRNSDPLYQLSRRERRREQKRIKEAQNFFNKTAEGYINEIMDIAFGGEANQVEILDFWDRRWRNFSRIHIQRYLYRFKTPEEREKLTNHFIQFANRYHERLNQASETSKKPPAMALSKEEKVLEIQRKLKEAGVSTQAKTFKGLERAMVKSLREDNMYYEEIKKLIHSEL